MSGPDNYDEIKARIHRNAARHAEANVYSMNNPYLTRSQKVLVEAWFQFPVGVFGYVILTYLALHPHHYFRAFVFAYIAVGIVALIARSIFLPDRLLLALGILFAGWTQTAVSLAFIALFLYRTDWGGTAIALASATGLLTILAPSMHLYTILSPRGMHCKYAFAKSRFGIAYPFENRE